VGWSSAAFAGVTPVTVSDTSALNPSAQNQDVTYDATLVTADSGNLDFGDTIEFQDGGSDIAGCSAQLLGVTGTPGTYEATCTEAGSSMSVGAHVITAIFNGDSVYAYASGSLTQSVSLGTTTTVISSPSPGTAVDYGSESNNSFNVTVAALSSSDPSPSGSVDLDFSQSGSVAYSCTAYVNGSGNGSSDGNCNINDTSLNAGSYMLTALYGGDGTYMPSASAPQIFTVGEVTTQMNVFPVPGYAFYGAENGNFFIVGAGGGNNGNPSGDFTITSDGVTLNAPGTCSAGNGGGNPCYFDSATALAASATPYTVVTSYPGDVNFMPASATTLLTVFPATSSTTLSLSSSAASYGDESSLNLSATVTAGTTGVPGGSIDIESGGISVCTVTTLKAVGSDAAVGECTIADTALPTGIAALTADYQGDGNYQSSISAAKPLTITSSSPVLPSSFGPRPQLVIARNAVDHPRPGPFVSVGLTCEYATCGGSVKMTKAVWVDVRPGNNALKRRQSVVLAVGSYSFSRGESGVIDLALTPIGSRVLKVSNLKEPSAAVLSVSDTGGTRTTRTIYVT
jgi:hypothetical protein